MCVACDAEDAEAGRPLTDEERSARMDALLEKEKAEPRQGEWWLSFADEDKSLGVVVMPAIGFLHAIAEARFLGLNPGGEVLGAYLDPGTMPADKLCRLLTQEELAEFGEPYDPKEHE